MNNAGEAEALDPERVDDWLLRPAEAAKLVGMGRSTFDKAVKEGCIPQPRRAGKWIRFYKPELDHWIKTGELPKEREAS